MMNFLFVGGGTLGPVTPLLAVAKALSDRQNGSRFFWIGTPNGPERLLVEKKGMTFFALPVTKVPRYPSLLWIKLPFAMIAARKRAKKILRQIKPRAVITVGGFTAVPVIFEAKKMGIPCFTHQLDLVPGLANKKIASKCQSVTTSFEYERGPFGEWVSDERIATPVRFSLERLPSKIKASAAFGFDPHRKIVLVFGGGTGAQTLNECMDRTRAEWLKFCQILHITGEGKGTSDPHSLKGYVTKPFLGENMDDAYAAADLVICRSGIGALSEIAALKKAVILVPIPHSHQEANAHAFEERGAAVVVPQTLKNFDQEILATAKLLLSDERARKTMGERANLFFPTDDGSALATRILTCLKDEANLRK
ncbi:MAG TPA: UDP-N-acetylglucosamine--N-acetylmuramyl-(pentapeptide) pyrophosphoryl-undecaprenol N-acetylglucosamine transferase [Patescibacteria group bacterium]|nr:UDP-N-acetylglucosamine--N-acetylmuramyl-(pentapeptide) pyrophosphoryl-undecaprenol N-acetylglucosamine transferase [Patescibacteria group bacterium]